MAKQTISWVDRVENSGATADGRLSAAQANEIKDVVNDNFTENYDAIERLQAKGADIASATTTDIGAATGDFVHVTGTTTITGLGTITAGRKRIVRFAGNLTLTHNATSLILPTGANITTASNDVATFVSEGSGNWRCVEYTRANGFPLSGGTGQSSYTTGDLLSAGSSSTLSKIAAVSSGQFLKSAGTGTLPSYGNILKSNLENQYEKLGTIISSTWSSLTGWSNYGSATITVASNELVLNNASGTIDFTSGTSNTTYGNSNLEQFTVSMPIRVGTINSTNFGVGINLKSNHGIAGSTRSVGCRVEFVTGSIGRLYFYGSDGTGVLNATDQVISNLPTAIISAGDNITLQLTFFSNTYVATLYKSGIAINSITMVIPSTSPQSSSFVRQNCWRYSIQSYGGLNYVTTGFSVNANSAKLAPIMWIGDSITWGQGASTTSNSFARLVNKYSNSEGIVYASPGNRTDEIVVAEILALQPRVIFLTVGTNNILKGDSAGTFGTKYASLVDALIAGGYTVGVNLFLSTIPPFSIDATSYNAQIVSYINSLSSPNIKTYFDSFPLLRNGALTTLLPAYSDDGTHINDLGNLVLSQAIYAYLQSYLPFSSLKLSDQIPVTKDYSGNVMISNGGATKSLTRLQLVSNTDSSFVPLLQLTDVPNGGGVYMSGSLTGGGVIGYNSQFNGTVHIPFATSTANIQGLNGEVNIYGNSGLTIGTGYAPEKKFTAGINGSIAWGDGTGGNTQLSIRDAISTNDGGYLTAIGGACSLSSGVERVGGAWIVRNANLSSWGGAGGIQIFYAATGQTIGSTISLGSFERLRFDAKGNILLGTTTTPTNLTKGFVVNTGVAPSASLVDGYINYSADVSAGNATMFIRSEGGEIASLGSEFGMQSNHALNLCTNGTTRLIIAANGSTLTFSDALDIVFNATTGTKIGGSSAKLALYGATPIVQPNTGVTAATFVANTSGILNDTATWGGYTGGQIVAALKALGALA